MSSALSPLRSQGGNVVLDVGCPATARVESASNLGMPYSLFIEHDKVAADLRSICSRALVTFERRESGEVDVPFNDSSVYANFKRKLTAAPNVRAEAKQGDLSKFVWYYVKEGKGDMRVGVTVYPYRNGSKVTYVWVGNVVCPPNGTCNYDPSAGKRLSEVITSVAND
jgi:hypothetical protein